MRHLFVVLILFALLGAPAYAQFSPDRALSVRVATSGVVPLGTMGQQYYVGTGVTASLNFVPGGSGPGGRLDASGAFHKGRTIQNATPAGSRFQSFSTVGAMANVLYVFRADNPKPYLLAGVGAVRQFHHDEFSGNHKWDVALQTGAGVNWPLGRVSLNTEIALQSVPLSAWVFGPQVPISIGITF